MSQRRITIYDLASELNVSIAAISRAFNPNSKLRKEKRELILATAEKYGYKPNKMASRLSMDNFTIGVLNFSYIKPFYSEIIDGVMAAYNDLKDYKIDCDLHNLQRGEYTKEEAVAVLDSFLEKKYDGVIIIGIYEEWVIEKIDQLSDNGIKVVTVQYDMSKSKRVFSSLSNYDVIGEMAAQLCGMLLRGVVNKKTVMFTGNKISPIHQKLIEAFCRGSKIHDFDIVEIYDTQDNPEVAKEAVAKAFSEHPDISAIYASSANSLPICKYLETVEIGKQVAFVASDVFPELHPYIENGYIDATIYQEPYKMGYGAFDKLSRLLVDGETPAEPLMSTPRVVMSANLSDYR